MLKNRYTYITYVFCLGIFFGVFACKNKPKPTITTDILPTNIPMNTVVITPETYKNGYNQLPNDEAGKIIRDAIQYAGGWENWLSKKGLTFYKTVIYYDSVGKITKSSRSLQELNLFPNFKSKASWVDSGKQITVLNNGQQAWRLENGKIKTDDKSKNSAWNSSFGTHYVMCMPFKLADPGAHFTYEGLVNLPNGKKALSVKVTYDDWAGSSGRFHKWTYFFDPKTHQLMANFLNYGGGCSFTEYLKDTIVGGIRYNLKRNSYQTDSTMSFIKLKETYKNDSIRLGDNFSDAKFLTPPQ